MSRVTDIELQRRASLISKGSLSDEESHELAALDEKLDGFMNAKLQALIHATMRDGAETDALISQVDDLIKSL